MGHVVYSYLVMETRFSGEDRFPHIERRHQLTNICAEQDRPHLFGIAASIGPSGNNQKLTHINKYRVDAICFVVFFFIYVKFIEQFIAFITYCLIQSFFYN